MKSIVTEYVKWFIFIFLTLLLEIKIICLKWFQNWPFRIYSANSSRLPTDVCLKTNSNDGQLQGSFQRTFIEENHALADNDFSAKQRWYKECISLFVVYFSLTLNSNWTSALCNYQGVAPIVMVDRQTQTDAKYKCSAIIVGIPKTERKWKDNLSVRYALELNQKHCEQQKW